MQAWWHKAPRRVRLPDKEVLEILSFPRNKLIILKYLKMQKQKY